MDHNMIAMELAFQLAKSGEVSGLSEKIAKGLKRQGIFRSKGPILKQQLTDLLRDARLNRTIEFTGQRPLLGWSHDTAGTCRQSTLNIRL
jgi:hypothetical protein